ncbi:hypothetical protein CSOJ01_15923, partial [Colletotrichum sojae]
MFNGARRDLLVWMSQIPSPTASASYHFPLGSEDEATIAKSSSEDEKRLQYLLGAVDDLFDTCEDTIRHTDNSMRCWLRSQDPHRPYKAPFELVGRRATSQAYRRTVKMLLCFCSRAIDTLWSDNVWADVDMDTSGRPVMEEDSDEEDETATDNESDSDDEPGEEDLDKLLSLQQNTNNTNFEDRPTADKDNFGPVLGNNPPENAVQDLILQLLYFLFTEEYEGGRSGSTLLVYFCGVLGISSDGTVFQRPKNYTKHLSALIYCARLIIMEVLLPRKSHPYAGYPARPRRGQLDRLNEVRREKMCLGSQAPLGELISLRAYGRALSMSDGPSFRVNWSDDGKILRWDEHRLSMAQFRSLADDVLQRSDSAVDDLMYGWNPGCDLSKVRDRMANTSQGYSFVSEPANNLHEAYLNLSQQVSLANLDGLLSANGWVKHKVRRYLESSDTLLKLLLLLAYLTGGQAARGTELMSVEHQNGSSTSRGIYVYSGTMVIVTRHHKSRHATNNEFQVARFLPAAVGRLLYLYLVYIRPFSRMLCRVCLGADNTDSSVLFRPLLRPTDHWGTEKLSKELSRRATHLFGFTLSVRTYRQISIAITEKHIKQIRRPFNRLQDKGPDAPIESALAWQSGHRPLQRATTYGLDGAYPDSLQPALLQVYKWASGEWHDFLQLKSSTLEPPHSHPRQHNPSSQCRKSSILERIPKATALLEGDRERDQRAEVEVQHKGQKRQYLPLVTTLPKQTGDNRHRTKRSRQNANREHDSEEDQPRPGPWDQVDDADFPENTKVPWIIKIPFMVKPSAGVGGLLAVNYVSLRMGNPLESLETTASTTVVGRANVARWLRTFSTGFSNCHSLDSLKGTSVATDRPALAAFVILWMRKYYVSKHEKLRLANLAGGLRQMTGDGRATFRGNQEQVLRAIISGESPIVQVMGTGGGKSLSFMLPAFCSGEGVTVVVTPLVALRTDMHARCSRAGITSHVWQSHKANQAASIVFVTPESAVTKGFRDFVSRLEARQALDRVVVDECHVVLEGTRAFRPQLRELGAALQEFGAQLVCLTATLAPGDEPAFYRTMGIDVGRVRMFRMASTRRNIEYEVHMAESTGAAARVGEADEVEKEAARTVRQWADEDGEGKAVVYCTSIEQVKRLATELACAAFYSDVDTTEGKAERLAAWRNGNGADGGIVVATNALGLGIDIPDVRLVVHAGMPRELRRFVQESGRGGRDGQRSRSVVVCREEAKSRMEAACQEYISTTGCRRAVLDRVMDGRTDRFECEADEEACDVCRQGGEGPGEAREGAGDAREGAGDAREGA